MSADAADRPASNEIRPGGNSRRRAGSSSLPCGYGRPLPRCGRVPRFLSATRIHSRCQLSLSPGIIRLAAWKHSLTVPPPSCVSPRPPSKLIRQPRVLRPMMPAVRLEMRLPVFGDPLDEIVFVACHDAHLLDVRSMISVRSSNLNGYERCLAQASEVAAAAGGAVESRRGGSFPLDFRRSGFHNGNRFTERHRGGSDIMGVIVANQTKAAVPQNRSRCPERGADRSAAQACPHGARPHAEEGG